MTVIMAVITKVGAFGRVGKMTDTIEKSGVQFLLQVICRNVRGTFSFQAASACQVVMGT